MTDDKAQQAYQIFAEALNQVDATRDAWLQHACQGDMQLRKEVDALLDADRESEDFLDLAVPPIEQAPDLVGQKLGQYRITKRIGEGGMAVVYLAERTSGDFEQQVAIKVIRMDVGSTETRLRFNQERQVLAQLQHPYITRLFDGGVTSEGAPYFVMEYVQGTAIDEYCDQHRLTLRERLRLFVNVCEAVAEAHRHLVVHRDIKPNNILVSNQGVPKLLDFGIAKLLQTEPAERALTQAGSRAFTPEYASPEQVLGEVITTASDVYSLGALLYRLLTGSALYAVGSVYEYLHAITDTPPTRPSAAVLKLARDPVTREEIQELTRRRSTTARQLGTRLKGDLDNILMKALERDAPERYATAHEFAQDIRLWLDGRPVHAHQPGIGYRLSKHLARNKLSSAMAILFLLSLLIGSGVSLWQAQLARQERDHARVQAEKAEQISQFLQEMLASADPRLGRRDITVAEVLANAAQETGQKLAGQPLLQADVLATIGRTYQALGLFEQAESSLLKALEIITPEVGTSSVEYVALLAELAALLTEVGRYDESEPKLRQALAILDEKEGRKAGYAKTANSLAILLVNTARVEEAEPLYIESIAIYRQLSGDNGKSLAEVLNNYGMLSGYTGAFDAAESSHRESLEILQRVHPPGHPSIVEGLFNLGSAIDFQGRYDEAEPLFREVLEGRRELLGEEHPSYIWTQVTLGNNLSYQMKMSEAESVLREALAKAETAMPDTHPVRAYGLVVLGSVLCESQHPDEGVQQLQRALTLREASLPENHWALANTRSVLGGCMTGSGRLQEAQQLLLESLAFQQDYHGLKHEKTIDTLNRLVRLYEIQSNAERAEHYRALLN